MSLDTTLDITFGGQPFIVVPPAGVDTASLDIAFLGAPFVTPLDNQILDITVSESATATDSTSISVVRTVGVTESVTATSTASTQVTRSAYVTEGALATDSVAVTILHSEDTESAAIFSLDYVYHGQPFVQFGENTFGLEYAFGGQPFVASSAPFSGQMQPSIKIFSDPQML